MKGRTIAYTAAELDWIRDHASDPRAAMHAAFVARFDRPDVKLTNLNALCKRNRWLTGRNGQFCTGATPVNKGQKGVCAPGSEKGWFKTGTRTGRANHLYEPIGTERMSKSGYLERKINDDLPMHRRWRAVHLIRWEGANGPIPPGHCLKCLDGDRLNTDPANWLAVPRALLPRLAGRWRSLPYDSAAPDLKPILLAAARLDHAARQLRKDRTP